MRVMTVRIGSGQDLSKLSLRIGTDLKNIKTLKLLEDKKETTPRSISKDNPSPLLSYYWNGMPRFVQNKQKPFAQFDVQTDLSPKKLSEAFDQKITEKTRSIWFPKLKRGLGDWAWIDESGIRPRYPFYVISKGRPQCITARALKNMGIPFQIVVEPNEVNVYQKKWGDAVITGDFDTTTKSSIPVRNYVDEISPQDKYWLLDDNIEAFNILTDNQKYVSMTPTMFAAAEDFTERFYNVGQAGFNYYSFAKKTDRVPPYYLNTRIYSCILMDRNVKQVRVNGKLWRGRYNEDTDLSLRILKADYCTILFNAFLAGKMTTQRAKGGNTDTVYTDGDERRTFAESLQKQHPDCVKVARRFKRWHHLVDYSQFKQKLRVRPDYPIRDYKLVLDPNARKRFIK